MSNNLQLAQKFAGNLFYFLSRFKSASNLRKDNFFNRPGKKKKVFNKIFNKKQIHINLTPKKNQINIRTTDALLKVFIRHNLSGNYQKKKITEELLVLPFNLFLSVL